MMRIFHTPCRFCVLLHLKTKWSVIKGIFVLFGWVFFWLKLKILNQSVEEMMLNNIRKLTSAWLKNPHTLI